MAILTFSWPTSSVSIPGVATEATLQSVLTEAQAINTNTADVATETTLGSLNSKVPANLTVTSTRLLVDGSGVTQPVSATNLDVRDLVFATDKVDVSGSSVSISATDLDIRDLAFATDKVDVSGSSVTVSATNLDVRDLVFATDKVDASGSSVSVSNFPATQDVSATNLDIRDLTSVSDSVSAVQSGTWNINNISGTVSLPTGASTSAKQPALGVAGTPSSDVITVQGITSMTALKVDGSAVTQPVSMGTSSTATLSNVTSSATSTSILSSNASRKGMFLYNDSTASLYLKFGTTASTTSFTVLIPPNGYYEMPSIGIYTGALDGIWSAANGSARVTELT